MGTNKNSASNTTEDYKGFYNAQRRAILDTAVFHVALRWSTLKYYFCTFLAINPLLMVR